MQPEQNFTPAAKDGSRTVSYGGVAEVKKIRKPVSKLLQATDAMLARQQARIPEAFFQIMP